MFEKNGIVYANGYNKNKELKVVEIKIVEKLCMIVVFSNGEKKIFDATNLLKMPAYEKLKDETIFENVKIENGIITWDNGNIDIGTETVYNESFDYDEEIA